MKKPAQPGGFTLLEVLLSVAILALISSMVYSSFVPSLEAIQTVESQRALYRRGRIMLRRMESEIQSAFLGIYPASDRRGCEIDQRDCPYYFIGENSGDEDTLRFTSMGGRPKSRGYPATDQLAIQYVVERDEDTKNLILKCIKSPIYKRDFENDIKAVPIPCFKKIRKFNLRYVNRGTTNEFLEEWDSARGLDENQSKNLPRAVEIEIEFGDENDEEDNFINLKSLVEIPFSKPPEEKKE